MLVVQRLSGETMFMRLDQTDVHLTVASIRGRDKVGLTLERDRLGERRGANIENFWLSPDQTFQLDPDRSFSILQIAGDKVRLAFNLRTEDPLHRLEVWQAIVRETGGSNGSDGLSGSPVPK